MCVCVCVCESALPMCGFLIQVFLLTLLENETSNHLCNHYALCRKCSLSGSVPCFCQRYMLLTWLRMRRKSYAD